MNNNSNNIQNPVTNNQIPQTNNPSVQPQQVLNQNSNVKPKVVTNPVNIPNQTPQPQVVNNNQNVNNTVPKKEKKKKPLFTVLLFLMVLGMAFYIYTDYQKDLKNKCSPLVTKNNKVNTLDINSTIVQDLYNKVKTDIKEDVASTEFDDTMKLYLAYRQIPNKDIYESNCNLFDNNSMPSIKCDENSSFTPVAFKEETLTREIKKLFGEDISIENKNIQLGTSCIGDYQYIKDRGEYVKGECTSTNANLYNVEKKLISATVVNDTITLKEKVRYYGSENVNIDRLKNGVYIYTFKLDNNYNYVYISKNIDEK